MKGLPPKPRRQDSEALSLHTTPDDYEYRDLPENDAPPTYTESEFAAGSSSAANRSTEVAPALLDHALTVHTVQEDMYAPYLQSEGLGKLRPVPLSTKDTLVRLDKRLEDPYNLYAYIMDYLRIHPPMPVVRLHGYHYEEKTKHNGKKREKETNRVTDIDIEINMQSLLRHAFDEEMWHESVVEDHDLAYRGGFRKTKERQRAQPVELSDVPSPDLKEWCERFCASKSRWKVFRVRREVIGIDEQLLTTLLSELVRSTDYDGHVDITFPLHARKIDIYGAHWTNLVRTSWLQYIFYPSMLWILLWPLLYLFTRWYCVYTVKWYNSALRPQERSSNKVYATISEREWYVLHRGYLRHLVLQRHKGLAETAQAIEWNANAQYNSNRG